MDIEVKKNNETKVEELLQSIKDIGDGKLAKEEFKTKMDQLKEAVDQRNKELDEQFGDMENNLETKLSQMAEKIGDAFEKTNYNKPDEEFKTGKTFGEFLSKVKAHHPDVKFLAEQTGSDGGYLVPEQHLNEILRIELETSVMRNSGSRIIPMSTSLLKVPALAYSNNTSGNILGGVASYWADEGETLTDSKPEFKRVTLEPKKLIGYTEASEELTADAIVSIGGLLSQLFGEVLAFEEDDSFINGNGVAKPLGILSAPARVTVSRGTATAVVQTSNVVDMLARFRGNLNRSVWVCNQSVLPSLYKLKDENDNYIWHPGMSGSIAQGAVGTLYGRPIKISEKLPAVGDEGDIMLCDFGHYLIGDRTGLRIEESNHYKFANDLKVWRMIKRVDGQPWLESAITPRNGGSTLSPFVVLADKA